MGAESEVPAADMGGLYEALRVESFPLDRQGLYYAVGDQQVVSAIGEALPARALIDEIEEEQFADADAVCGALQGVVRRRVAEQRRA